MMISHRSARKYKRKLRHKASVNLGRSVTASSTPDPSAFDIAWPKPQVPVWIDALPLAAVLLMGVTLALFFSQDKTMPSPPDEVDMIWEEATPQPRVEEEPTPPPPPPSLLETPIPKPVPQAMPDPIPSPTAIPEEAPPSEAVFGLAEDALSEQGDLAVATGNTLMMSPGEVVQSPPLTLPPTIAPPDYDGPYLAALREEIMRLYPPKARRMRLEGKVRLLLKLDQYGRILKSALVESSGHALLDQGLLESLDQLGAFAPFPKGMNRKTWDLEIPVHFHLKARE